MRVIMEIPDVTQRTVTIHLNSLILEGGQLGLYKNPDTLSSEVLTPVGAMLCSSLQAVPGIHVMLGQYSFQVDVAAGFELLLSLWCVERAVATTLAGDDVFFAVITADSDVFVEPEFIRNPGREWFDELVNAATNRLRQRSQREAEEAKQVVQGLQYLIKAAKEVESD